MGKVKYLMKRLTKMNYKAMFDKINVVHKKTGKTIIIISHDMNIVYKY